jgi:hypothetical protein
MFRLRSLLVFGLAVVLTVAVSTAHGRQGRKSTPHAVVVHRDIEVQADDGVTVRRQDPPVQYDDKGKPRKPTSEELKAFKGPDPKLPGYSAEYADLKNGQIVRVTISKKKKDSGSKEVSTDSAKKESDKPSWTKVGELVGQLSHLDSKSKKFTVKVDAVTLQAGRHQGRPAGANKEVIDDAYATRIVILADKDADKNKSK